MKIPCLSRHHETNEKWLVRCGPHPKSAPAHRPSLLRPSLARPIEGARPPVHRRHIDRRESKKTIHLTWTRPQALQESLRLPQRSGPLKDVSPCIQRRVASCLRCMCTKNICTFDAELVACCNEFSAACRMFTCRWLAAWKDILTILH